MRNLNSINMHDQDIILLSRLEDYRNRLKKERKELRTLPEGNLGFRQVSDHTEYVHLYKSSENDNHYIRKWLRVRSKSELIIAEKLDALEIPYRYDALIYYKNLVFSPDFTIYLNGILKYWEHCGMMSDPKYREYNTWKLGIYDEMGIVPWDNLIITYVAVDGAVNSAAIDAEIRNRLLIKTLYN